VTASAARLWRLEPQPAAGQAAGVADLVVRGLVKSFDANRLVLDGLGLDVHHGEAVALIGANGSGKSTLLRCCLRLIEPDAGEVRVLGSSVTGLEERALRRLRARVGFVFQRHNLVPRFSVLSNVLHGALALGWGPRAWGRSFASRELRALAMDCLDRVGLADLALRRADRLSGGQSQRVAIARVLMQRPSMILADEPVASLDPAAAEDVMRLFVDLIRRDDITLVFASHHLRHALDYADRIVGLRSGVVAVDAPARQLGAAELRGFYD
jgi:phosphonate transport system ATP-binding protein